LVFFVKALALQAQPATLKAQNKIICGLGCLLAEIIPMEPDAVDAAVGRSILKDYLAFKWSFSLPNARLPILRRNFKNVIIRNNVS
jgi:hypothetical protein